MSVSISAIYTTTTNDWNADRVSETDSGLSKDDGDIVQITPALPSGTRVVYRKVVDGINYYILIDSLNNAVKTGSIENNSIISKYEIKMYETYSVYTAACSSYGITPVSNKSGATPLFP